MRSVKNLWMNSDEVCQILECSKSYSYKLIKELNQELKKEGYITISGKVSRAYLEKKLFNLKL